MRLPQLVCAPTRSMAYPRGEQMAETDDNSELGLMRVPVGPAGQRARRREPVGGGWLVFAGTMVLIAATANAVFGITALAGDDSFSDDELLIGDLSTWGVLFLIVAAIQAIVALMIFARNPVGALGGIVAAMLSGTVALLTILAHPILSIVVMGVDVLVIFALWAYGFNR
jgi:hypothetical protein